MAHGTVALWPCGLNAHIWAFILWSAARNTASPLLLFSSLQCEYVYAAATVSTHADHEGQTVIMEPLVFWTIEGERPYVAG